MRRTGLLWSVVLLAACGSRSPIGVRGDDAAAGAQGGTAGADGGADAGRDVVVRVPQLHRSAPTPCPTDRPTPSCQHAASPLNGGNCTQDTDCTSGVNGRCGPSAPFDGLCDTCSYDECVTDADCSGGRPCDCRSGLVGAANVCSAGNCRVDADCGPGGYCSPSRPRCGYSGVETAAVGWFCRTPKDTCVDDFDCKTDPNVERECRYDGAAGSWRCIDYPGCPT